MSMFAPDAMQAFCPIVTILPIMRPEPVLITGAPKNDKFYTKYFKFFSSIFV